MSSPAREATLARRRRSRTLAVPGCIWFRLPSSSCAPTVLGCMS